MSHQKVAIALPLEEPLLEPFHAWGKRFDWSHVREVHLLHTVKMSITPIEFGMVELPDESTYREMIPTIKKFLRTEMKKIIPQDFSGEVFLHVNRDYSPAEEIMGLLKKEGISLVVVSTKDRHGLENVFHSSFTQQLIRHAPCDVYVVRPAAIEPSPARLEDAS